MKWARTISSLMLLMVASFAERARSLSQVQHQIVAWLRAADECASLGGRFDRVGVVFDIAGDKRGLAGVADAGATRPANGYVACFGEFEQAAVLAVPGDGEIAAGEFNRGAVSRLARGWVGAPRRCCCDAWRHTRCRPERLGMDVRRVDPQRRQARADLVHERRGPA